MNISICDPMEQRRLYERFVNDLHIYAVHQLMIRILEVSIPRCIVTPDGVEETYDDRTIQKMEILNHHLEDYIRAEYGSLLFLEEDT